MNDPHRPDHSLPSSALTPPSFSALTDKTIILGVTGSIAAFKAALIARKLVEDGADVQVILTERAGEFIGPSTFTGITSHPPSTNLFDLAASGETHLSHTERADLIVIAPATADIIARMAQGRADDLLAAVALSARAKIVVAPAMHPSMWSHPATQRNVAQLKADGRVIFVGPEFGDVASGDEGLGRMSEPETIVFEIRRLLSRQDLLGKHVVITAGPTVEDVDPVRFITNRSSGKMGYAIAERAAQRGARVTLVSGPVSLTPTQGVTLVKVRGALEMQRALDEILGDDLSRADALIMAAAVSDYRAQEVAKGKLKRKHDEIALTLIKNPDLLAEIGAKRKHPSPVLVGFAVETADDDGLVELARGKLRTKQVDMVVANHAAESLGRDDNRVWLVTATDAELVATAPKAVVAEAILDKLVERLAEVEP